MDTFQAGEITLEQVREYVWELPQTGEMRVPGRVFASETLLEEIADDKTLQQLQNAAHLPGITKHAICMPDGHQGYGFPVGGVGAMDAEEGCISPGAVGYDINCHPYDINVQLEFGRYRKIGELGERFEDERAIVADDGRVASDIQLFTESEEKPVYRVETTAGDHIRATPEHPFRTPERMETLGNLEEGDTVFVSPFLGIEHEDREEFTLLTESDFQDEDPQLTAFMREQGILPLTSIDENFQRLLKILGFFLGDGSFWGPQTWFYGEPEDLERIRQDIKAIGYTPSRIYSREREHDYQGYEFKRTEHRFYVGAKGFKKILLKLGAPGGKKVNSEFILLDWFERLAGWQQALFLSTFFGAEMSAPSAQHNMNLSCPKISQNRARQVADAGERFMEQIVEALSQLGVETQIERFDADSDREGTQRFRLGIKNDSENLIQFFTTIGYRYHREKQRKAIAAAQYLKRKERVIEERESISDRIAEMANRGTPVPDIIASVPVTHHFVRRTIRDEVKSRRRPPADFPGFDEFCDNIEVGDDLTIPAEISSIEQCGREPVYDIGVAHDAHNFLANGFVVSNCGVRMMKTNLTYDDIQGHEEDLVDALFTNIPSGLGGGGVVETDTETIEEILTRGARWAVDNDWGIESDLSHCEDEGYRPEADPDAVSERAKNRGKNQVGSLGSGNHFLEVQRVTDVYLDEVADTFGLAADQVVVLIHCGSRGLGHQVCTDYLREIEQTHADLLAELPDKELAAAPAGSELADRYYQAMGAAINFAWVNRQLVMHRTRQVFAREFETTWEDLEMELLYDVAHNIAKKERHDVDGDQRDLYVHRKGATRSFPAGRPELPAVYRDVGQPVIIPGSMGTGSYVLRGGERSLELTFGSTAHGAGRLMSRTQAKNTYWGEDVQDELEADHQVYVRAQSGATVAEEAPGVYKNVDEVVRVSSELGIGDPVVRTFPICNIKG